MIVINYQYPEKDLQRQELEQTSEMMIFDLPLHLLLRVSYSSQFINNLVDKIRTSDKGNIFSELTFKVPRMHPPIAKGTQHRKDISKCVHTEIGRRKTVVNDPAVTFFDAERTFAFH